MKLMGIWCSGSFYLLLSLFCNGTSFLIQRSGQRLHPIQMSNGIVYIAVTVDGYIATEDGDVSFLEDYPEPDGMKNFETFLSGIDAIVMGGNTFRKVLSFDTWPYGDIPLVVWTRRDDLVIPQSIQASVTLSCKDPNEIMRDLEAKGCKRVYIDGGITIQNFLAAGLVNEMILTRVPILLGSGIPLFDKGERYKLRHVETDLFPSGLVSSRYEVATDQDR